MSDAKKCDRCGQFMDWFDRTEVSGNLLGMTLLIGAKYTLRDGWHPDKVDLCKSCARPLVEFMNHWWMSP